MNSFSERSSQLSLTPADLSPAGGTLPAAVQWLEGALLGSAASAIAIIAIGFVGFAMLSGRLDWRIGARVALGIFILFGAPSIARELMVLARSEGQAAPAVIASEDAPPPPATPKDAPNADPYAGASLIRQ